MLAAAGHKVRLYEVGNDGITSKAAKVAAAVNVAYDRRQAEAVASLVREHSADIVHVHNFFPKLTPAVHEGAATAGAAVVQTLHNFRLICANGLLLRRGTPCDKCEQSKVWAAVHRCYRGSLAGSAAVAAMQMRALHTNHWHRFVDKFITLSEFARTKFIAAGLAPSSVAIKPNFVTPHVQRPSFRENRAIFVGRLAEEKGVGVLLEAWKSVPDFQLLVVGDGPDRKKLEKLAPPNVVFAGSVSPEEARTLVGGSRCLIIPSIWYEPFGMVVIEAYEQGVPVIASRIGSLVDLIKPGVSGLHVQPGDPLSLSAAVSEFLSRPELEVALRSGAAAEFKANFTEERNATLLSEIYLDALSRRRARLI